MSRQKQQVNKPINKRVLILCEGKCTEPNYFRSLKLDKQKTNKLSGLRIVIHKTIKNTAKELVAEAIRLKTEAVKERNPYNEIWVVVDRDGYTKHPESFNRANAKQIKIAFSSTCFEYWFLLHFVYSTAPFNDCETLIRTLKIHIPDYDKNVDFYDTLKPHMDTAINRGKQIINHWEEVNNGIPIWQYNPYTDVSLLVEKLLSL